MDITKIDTYSLISNNYTIKSIEGAEKGGTTENFMEQTESVAPDIPNLSIKQYSPFRLQRYLTGKTCNRNLRLKCY